jgi:charged multivesicular body protein 4
MSYFTGKGKDTRQSARDSIVALRSQLLILDKKEEHLQKKIEEELKKAKTNATSNKRRVFARDSFASSNGSIWSYSPLPSRLGCAQTETSIRDRVEPNGWNQDDVGSSSERDWDGEPERGNHGSDEEGSRSTEGYTWQSVRHSIDESGVWQADQVLSLSNINKVDATMESIREQMDLSNEISDAISNPVNMGIEVDDVSIYSHIPDSQGWTPQSS